MEEQRAAFIERRHCISCGSNRLDELAGGRFGDEPLRTFLDRDPWGTSPLPYIENERWAYVRCTACGQTFHKRVLAPAWNERRFSEWMSESAIRQFSAHADTPAHRFAKGREHVQHVLRIEKMTRALRGGQEVRILDFGCGFGDFLAVCERFGFVCCGIDRSPARRQGGQVHIVSDIEDLPASMRFHAITLFEVLEHLDAPLAALQSLHALMLPDGVLVLETPDCSNVTDIRTERDYRKIHPLDHINAYTPETLRRIAMRAGFRPVAAPIVHVTGDALRVVKTEIKRFAGALFPSTTQRYFRKMPVEASSSP